jgi:predicted nuclease of predicted toxin-antitoxin system
MTFAHVCSSPRNAAKSFASRRKLVRAFWIDAQLPPQLTEWLRAEFGSDAFALRELGLRDADDRTIFERARAADVIPMSKDVDFVDLVSRFGAPPKLIWLTCGNVSNDALRALLKARLALALTVLESDDIVEVS